MKALRAAVVSVALSFHFHGAEAAQDHSTTAPECSEVAAYLGQPELALNQASCDRAYITMQDDWCAHPTSSSAIAVCSEPQLKSLARERKKAYDAAQTHLDPGARTTLKKDQEAWGASYAQTCGITPKLAPTLPLAAQIKECMARAGRARLAYLREYGTPSGAQAKAHQPDSEAQASSLPPGPPVAVPVTKVSETYNDPHAYCRAVGTIDEPDRRYVGPKQPKSFWHEFDLEEGHGMLEWRCMDGAVYACGSGNSPICDKLDPYYRLDDIKQFCRENPQADIVPSVVMGHQPVGWVCENGNPVLKQGDFRVDKRGYPVMDWKLMWQRESDTSTDVSAPNSPTPQYVVVPPSAAQEEHPSRSQYANWQDCVQHHPGHGDLCDGTGVYYYTKEEWNKGVDERQAEICNENPVGVTSAACINLEFKQAKAALEHCHRSFIEKGAEYLIAPVESDGVSRACKKLEENKLRFEESFCSDQKLSPNLDFCGH